MNTPTLKFYPNIKKRSTKDNSIPVYARIIFNNMKAEVKLPIPILNINELQYWNKTLMLLEKGISKTDVNEQIESYQYSFRNFLKDNLHNLYNFNSKTILNHLCGKNEKESEITLSFFFNNFLHQSILLDTNISNGTKKNYKKAINHLMKLEKTVKLTTNFRFKLTSDFRSKLTSGFRSKLTT